MDKQVKTSIIICLITGILILFIGIAAYKAEKKHVDKLYLVVHSLIKETAEECYLKSICEGEITLQDLYDKMNLAVVVDPVTKEDMDPKLCLEYQAEEVVFCN